MPSVVTVADERGAHGAGAWLPDAVVGVRCVAMMAESPGVISTPAGRSRTARGATMARLPVAGHHRPKPSCISARTTLAGNAALAYSTVRRGVLAWPFAALVSPVLLPAARFRGAPRAS